MKSVPWHLEYSIRGVRDSRCGDNFYDLGLNRYVIISAFSDLFFYVSSAILNDAITGKGLWQDTLRASVANALHTFGDFWTLSDPTIYRVLTMDPKLTSTTQGKG